MPAFPDSGRYFIVSETGRVLEADANGFLQNGARIQTWRQYNGLNQIWEIARLDSAGYSFLNVAGQRLLEAESTTIDHDTGQLQLWQQRSGSLNQAWELLHLGGDAFAIRCRASGITKVVQLEDNVVDRGAKAELGDFDGRRSQRWRFVRTFNAAVVRDDEVDLRPNQTPIKNQGSRLSCTYFGTTAALEAAYKKAGYGNINLSEEFWSIMGKALWLHPYWDQISHANYTENQMAGTGGGGSAKWYKKGLRIPKDDAVPYRPEEYVPGTWNSRDQKVINDFNFSLFSRNVLRAGDYYGARDHVDFVESDFANAARYEAVLRLGYEVVVDLRSLYGGPHNVLLVGFDRSTPDGPVFYVKNSWGPDGADPRVACETKRYAEVLPDIFSAAYVLDPVAPAAWPELAFLGRWQLIFDGHRGVLDIYHIPGVSLLDEEVPGIPDRRIGVFYDASGKAHRVNGSITGNTITFFVSGESPNLRWDQLKGRKFIYHLNPNVGVMTGFHVDEHDGPRYPGVASKGVSIRHLAPPGSGLAGLANRTWVGLIADHQGAVQFGPGSAASVRGTFQRADRTSRSVEASLRRDGQIAIQIEGSGGPAIGRFLNHAPGLVAGHTVDSRPFYLAYYPARIPAEIPPVQPELERT